MMSSMQATVMASVEMINRNMMTMSVSSITMSISSMTKTAITMTMSVVDWDKFTVVEDKRLAYYDFAIKLYMCYNGNRRRQVLDYFDDVMHWLDNFYDFRFLVFVSAMPRINCNNYCQHKECRKGAKQSFHGDEKNSPSFRKILSL
ncbi:hypothetical protein X975_27177, partial [Stegodyphus mimosarum]